MTQEHDKRSGRINNAIFGIMVLLTLGLFVSIVIWFIPRDIVKLELKVDPPVVSKAEGLKLQTTVETFVNGVSSYETILDCETGRFFLAQFESITTPTPPREEMILLEVNQIVPVGTECSVKTQGNHIIEVLPFASRTYFTSFESNKFIIEE